MKTKLLTSLLLVFVLGTPAYAQEDWFFGAAYETSLASGKAADFAGPFSWRGASFSGRRAVRDNFTVGFLTGWHVMNDEGVVSTSLDDQGLQQVSRLPRLRTLLVNGCPITDTGLQKLAGMRNLRELDVRGTQVTGTGIRRLSGQRWMNIVTEQTANER